MIEIAQFGAGRIGQIHASNIAAFKDVRLRYVVDVNAEAAQKLAARHGAKVVSEKEAFADPKVGAVLIASSTDTHARLAIAAAQAGKPIFCEKPIDLSLKKVDACLAEVSKAGVPMFVGVAAREMLGQAMRTGEFADKDFSAMLDYVCEQAKIKSPRL